MRLRFAALPLRARRQRGRGLSQQRAAGTGGGPGDEDDGAAGAVEHDEVRGDACADAIVEERTSS